MYVSVVCFTPAVYTPSLRVFFLLVRRPTRPTLFPYTTLFRSERSARRRPAARRRAAAGRAARRERSDRKSTRLNSSHANISYAVFCLKKKNTTLTDSLL